MRVLLMLQTNCHLAFPGGGSAASSSSLGEVIIYDALTLKVLNKVAACQSKVAAMSFCRQGTLLATASEQGTVVRVFTVPGAQQVSVSYISCCVYMHSQPHVLHASFRMIIVAICYSPHIAVNGLLRCT
jgi:hypothetical protein